MKISTKVKLQQFRKSKINKVFNIVNVGLILLTTGLFVLFILLIILTIGLSMWSPPVERIESPLDGYISLVEVEGQNTIYLEALEEELIFTTLTNVNVKEEIKLYYYTDAGTVLYLTIDGDQVTRNQDDQYIIPAGSHELFFRLSKSVIVERERNYTAIKVEFNLTDRVLLSNEFRDMDLSNRTKKQQIILTEDSVGEYVGTYQRLTIYKVIKTLFTITVIYSSINLIKIIVLYILTKHKKRPLQM